jgi:hypothetical protein
MAMAMLYYKRVFPKVKRIGWEKIKYLGKI